MSRNCSGVISAGLAAILLAGCNSGEETAADEAAGSLQLGALGAPDIERHEIYGTVCGFREAGGSIRALALIQPEQAWVKLDGEAVALPVADDAGEGPLGIGLAYTAAPASLSLAVEGEEKASGGGRSETGATLTVRTAAGDTAELSGTLQCSSGSV